MSALSASNLTVSLGTKEIVRDASLSLNAGELVALVGPNGAGKTTLMRALAGLVPARGTITFAGKPLGGLSPRERARMVSYLPQGHVFHWPMSVESIVMLGRAPHADAFIGATPDDRAAVAQALAVDRNSGLRGASPSPRSRAARRRAWRWPAPSPRRRQCFLRTSRRPHSIRGTSLS